MATSTERTEQTQSANTRHPSALKDDTEDENNSFEGSEEDLEEDIGSGLEEGDLYLIPNDFNVATINSFIDRDIIKAPFYQRHYVWDLRKASLFIESILFGFPIPTIFLQDTTTEGGRKKYDIIDGQQRLLTIYFYINNAFPKNDEARNALREEGKIKDIITNKSLFREFKLNLPNLHSEPIQSKKGHGRYHDYSYKKLGEIEGNPMQDNFDLTTIPITAIRMDKSKNSPSKIYEIYRRLNTGGVILKPQQVRAAVYNSEFYETIYELNKNKAWRDIINIEHASKNMADIEALLRAVAFLMFGSEYKGSMLGFLNDCSHEMMQQGQTESINFVKKVFLIFFELSKKLSFMREVKSKKGKTREMFSIPAFEAIFVAACEEAWKSKNAERVKKINQEKLKTFLKSKELAELLSSSTAGTDNVNKRLTLARKYFS